MVLFPFWKKKNWFTWGLSCSHSYVKWHQQQQGHDFRTKAAVTLQALMLGSNHSALKVPISYPILSYPIYKVPYISYCEQTCALKPPACTLFNSRIARAWSRCMNNKHHRIWDAIHHKPSTERLFALEV